MLLRVITLASLVVLAAALVRGAPSAFSQEGHPRLLLDMNVANNSGPCNPIDDEVSAAVGESVAVQVCLLDHAELPAPYGFTLEIDYDDRSVRAPEGETSDNRSIDANPDINDGPGPDGLGEGWDCDFLDSERSRPSSEPPPAQANCFAPLGVEDPGELEADPALLATLSFEVTGEGAAFIAATPQTIVAFWQADLRQCGSTLDCGGGYILSGGATAPPDQPTTAAGTPDRGDGADATPDGDGGSDGQGDDGDGDANGDGDGGTGDDGDGDGGEDNGSGNGSGDADGDGAATDSDDDDGGNNAWWIPLIVAVVLLAVAGGGAYAYLRSSRGRE
jgi:hypothetical protein